MFWLANNGVTFAHVDGMPDKTNVTCYNCQKKRHYSNECPIPDKQKSGDQALTNGDAGASAADTSANRKTGTQVLMAGIGSGEFDGQDTAFQFMQQGVVFNINENGRVPKSWILLDN
jgi:hypothetical protein